MENKRIETELERLKRFDGSDDHPEHRCQRCTGRNLSCWFADNDEWNKVVGDDFGILCPNCFNELSAIKGIQPTAWRLSREGDAPLTDKLREQIYNLTEKHQIEIDELKKYITHKGGCKKFNHLHNMVAGVNLNTCTCGLDKLTDN